MDRFAISSYSCIKIGYSPNVFHKGVYHYVLEYNEHDIRIVSINFGIHTLISILSSLFAIQGFIEQNTVYTNSIPISTNDILKGNYTKELIISREVDSDDVKFTINSINFTSDIKVINSSFTFKINSEYIGSLYSGIEELFIIHYNKL